MKTKKNVRYKIIFQDDCYKEYPHLVEASKAAKIQHIFTKQWSGGKITDEQEEFAYDNSIPLNDDISRLTFTNPKRS